MTTTPATYSAGAGAALDRAFGALADPTRRRVIELLRRSPLPAGELADACKSSRPAMSRHLRILRTSGLVETATDRDAADDARLRVFQLRPEPFDALRTWLDEVDRFWTDQLAGFAAHVEQAGRATPAVQVGRTTPAAQVGRTTPAAQVGRTTPVARVGSAAPGGAYPTAAVAKRRRR